MANAKISDNSVFIPETSDVRNIGGLAGFTGSDNAKITGQFLAQSVVNESGSGIGINDGSGNINSRVAFYGVGNPSDTLAGAEGFQYYSANSGNSTPASLQLGVAGGNQYDAGNLILLGNYIGGSTSPKVEFRANDTADPNDFKSFIITPSDSATNDQTWILPEALPTAGQVLEANSVSTNDVTLSWVNAGSGGGDSVQTLTGLTWDYNNGNSAIFTPSDNGSNPIDVLVASNFPSGARGALKVIPTNTTKFALFAGSKLPSSQNVLTISAVEPTILYYFYDGTNFYWFYDINYIDPIYPQPQAPDPTVDGNYNLLGFWFPGSYAGTDGAGVALTAAWTKSAGGALIGDLLRVGSASTTNPAIRWYARDEAAQEAPYWALSEGTTNSGNWESGTLSTTIGTWSATFYIKVLSTTSGGYEGILDPNKNDDEALYLLNKRLYLYSPNNYVQGNFPAFTPAGTTTSNQENPNSFSLQDEWIFCHVSFLHNGGSSLVTTYIGCQDTFDASTSQGGTGTILGRDGTPITLTSDGLYVTNVAVGTLNDGNWTSVEFGSASNGTYDWAGGHLGLLAMYAQELPATVVQSNWASTRPAYYIT